MDNETPSQVGMTSPACYQIVVLGKLDENWSEWFNGAIILAEQTERGTTNSKLICNVRDQSELLGILNQLNSLNLPLIQVSIAT